MKQHIFGRSILGGLVLIASVMLPRAGSEKEDRRTLIEGRLDRLKGYELPYIYRGEIGQIIDSSKAKSPRRDAKEFFEGYLGKRISLLNKDWENADYKEEEGTNVCFGENGKDLFLIDKEGKVWLYQRAD